MLQDAAHARLLASGHRHFLPDSLQDKDKEEFARGYAADLEGETEDLRKCARDTKDFRSALESMEEALRGHREEKLSAAVEALRASKWSIMVDVEQVSHIFW